MVYMESMKISLKPKTTVVKWLIVLTVSLLLFFGVISDPSSVGAVWWGNNVR